MEFKKGQTFLNHKDIYRFGWLCHRKGTCTLELVLKEDEEKSWFVNVPDTIAYGASKIAHTDLLEEFSLKEDDLPCGKN